MNFYTEGRAAYTARLAYSMCPYALGTWPARAWLAGYDSMRPVINVPEPKDNPTAYWQWAEDWTR